MKDSESNKIIDETIFRFAYKADVKKFAIGMRKAGVLIVPIGEKKVQIYAVNQMKPESRENAIKLGRKVFQEVVGQSK